MSEHDTVRNWLALSAAGLLEASEERQLREHAAQCAECAAELEQYAALSAEMRALPVPNPPAGLVTRTATLMLIEADRRQGSLLAGGAAILVFVMVLTLAETLRITVGDRLGDGWGDRAAMVWMLYATLSSLFGAAAALVLTAARRRFERGLV